MRKFIDDTSAQEKVPLITGIRHITEAKEEVHVHAWQSKRMMSTVLNNASAIGMQVNPAKTQLLCVTSAINYQVHSFIYCNGVKLLSGDNLKLLGFTMGRRPNADCHIKELRRKYGARAWILRNLLQASVPQHRLVQVYCALIRPVLEYPAVVFHSGLTEEASNAIERLQSASLRTIFGQDLSYGKCLEKAGITTLKERRDSLLQSFAKKAASSERFSDTWFPLNEESGYALRRTKKYKQERAARDRLISAPIFRMRQIMNELEK